MQRGSQNNIVTVGVVLACVLLLVIAVFVSAYHERVTRGKEFANLRELNNASIMFADDHKMRGPGFTGEGILPASTLTTGSTSLSGAAASSRFWILAQSYTRRPEIFISPREAGKQTWKSGSPMTTANFSYACLQLADNPTSVSQEHNEGRVSAWRHFREAAPSPLFCDRNIGPDNRDTNLSSLLSGKPWAGLVAWGDGTVRFAPTAMVETTYIDTTNDHDNLFADAPSTGVTESSSTPGFNALMVYN